VTWRGLSDLVPRLRREVEAAPTDLALRERAAWVACAAAKIDPDAPGAAFVVQSRINLSTLAILSRCAPQIWRCRPAVSALVHATDLHSIPDAPPLPLRSPGIVETRNPAKGEVLWGDVASLGWYQLDGAIYLLGLN
jgi:hypothetical protein